MRNKNYRYWLNLTAFALLISGLGLTSVLAYVSYQSAQSYLHPPRSHRGVDDNPGIYGLAFQEVRLITRDGIDLSAWYTPPENGALILVAHGHSDSKSRLTYALFARHGYGVLAWDFRAHGDSGGELSTLGYYEALDVEAALDYTLAQPGVQRVGAWGGSMGGVAVLEAAARRVEIEAVVADSAFTSVEEALEWIVNDDLFLPFIRVFAGLETGLSVDSLRPVDRIGELSPRAVMIVHGEADSTIPVAAAERLYEAAGEPRRLWTAPGVEHVGMLSAYPEEYGQRVVGFFDDYLVEQMRK